LEALSLQMGDNPHRSLNIIPKRTNKTSPVSKLVVEFDVDKDELYELLQYLGPDIYLPSDNLNSVQSLASRFARSIGEHNLFSCEYQSGDIIASYFVPYGNLQSNRSVNLLINNNKFQIKIPDFISVSTDKLYPAALVRLLRTRIYFFKAERLNIGDYQIGTENQLAPNASNLPGVLHYLLTTNPRRFERFNEYVNKIFPDIKQVTVPPIGPHTARIFIWPVDPKSEREDLAMQLSECGTGIGQILAILYVVLNSNYPGTILIDEPQSFLHPGAIRKLFGILKQDFPQHQYIIATHSPIVVSAANPETFILLSKIEAETRIRIINSSETKQLGLYLAEVGARLSDVFGAENILWVEGKTEELCFPLIYEKVVKKQLFDTAILAVRQTGDFEGKQSKTIFEVYQRLCQGKSLLPPAIGFIFDREGRTPQQQEDLIRQSNGSICFLPRRMFENYLLNPKAVSSVMSKVNDFRSTPIQPREIEVWLETNRWNKRYFRKNVNDKDRTDEFWLKNVHGAKILEDLFTEFSAQRVTYDKVVHGLALTEWIIENSPVDIEEISHLIVTILQKGEKAVGALS
jgi:hypothetical protein